MYDNIKILISINFLIYCWRVERNNSFNTPVSISLTCTAWRSCSPSQSSTSSVLCYSLLARSLSLNLTPRSYNYSCLSFLILSRLLTLTHYSSTLTVSFSSHPRPTGTEFYTSFCACRSPPSDFRLTTFSTFLRIAVSSTLGKSLIVCAISCLIHFHSPNLIFLVSSCPCFVSDRMKRMNLMNWTMSFDFWFIISLKRNVFFPS